MEIVISSKYLAQKLNEIDLETQDVEYVQVDPEKMTLIFGESSLEIEIVGFFGRQKMCQDDRRWDWLKKLVNQVDEQPLVLGLNDYSLEAIFQY